MQCHLEAFKAITCKNILERTVFKETTMYILHILYILPSSFSLSFSLNELQLKLKKELKNFR